MIPSPNTPPHMDGVELFLRGIDYPLSKDQLIAKAQLEGADQDTLNALEKLPDHEWQNQDEFVEDYNRTH